MEQIVDTTDKQVGQSLLILVFVVGLVSLAITISMATTGVTRVSDVVSESTGEEAAYAARAGIEEMLYRLSNDSNYGNGTSETIQSNTLGGSTYIATISGDTQMRIATATGSIGTHIRKNEIQLSASASAGSIVLAYAVQAGEGGITLNSNAKISGKHGADGNVYSNGIINGFSNSKIKGNAWAVDGINPGGGGHITITLDAYGSVIQHCSVKGDTYSPVYPSDCNVSGSKNITPAPTPLPLPVVDLDYWRNAAQAGGTINGDYVLNGGQSQTLGSKVITGNVVLNSNSTLTVTGTLWIYGEFRMNSNSKLKLDESFGENGTVILLDHPTDKANKGRLVMNSNAEVKKTSQDGYILFVSTNQSNDCSVKAASFNANAEAPGIIANDGCISLNSNAELVALAARQIMLNSNAEVEYDTGISSTLYLPGPGVGGEGSSFGWAINSWKEVP